MYQLISLGLEAASRGGHLTQWHSRWAQPVNCLIVVLLATPLGIALAWVLTLVMLDVEFTLNPLTLGAVDLGAIAITGLLGATTISKALSTRPAYLLREP